MIPIPSTRLQMRQQRQCSSRLHPFRRSHPKSRPELRLKWHVHTAKDVRRFFKVKQGGGGAHLEKATRWITAADAPAENPDTECRGILSDTAPLVPDRLRSCDEIRSAITLPLSDAPANGPTQCPRSSPKMGTVHFIGLLAAMTVGRWISIFASFFECPNCRQRTLIFLDAVGC